LLTEVALEKAAFGSQRPEIALLPIAQPLLKLHLGGMVVVASW